MGNTTSTPIPHITEEEVKQCKQQFAKGGVKELEAFLRNKAEKWKTVPLDVAIIGRSGTGKSSFINAIRGLKAGDKGAAPVGIVETTMEPIEYSHPKNELLKFWDLPGAGTLKFPQKEYLQKIGFNKYDFFLFISSDRFSEIDKWLIDTIVEKKKQFFFVRTMIDVCIDKDKTANQTFYDGDNGQIRCNAVLAEIRRNISDSLVDLYKKEKVFFINNYDKESYDFAQLQERIIEDYPSLKREAFVLSSSILGERMVKEKVKILRSNIWEGSLVSGAVAAAPVPGLSIAVDIGIIVAHSVIYLHQLGLDTESLQNIARDKSCDVTNLEQIVRNHIVNLSTREGIIVFIRAMPMVVAATVSEEVAHFVPIFGSLICAPISFGTTYYVLYSILNKMEEAALLVMKAAVNDIPI